MPFVDTTSIPNGYNQSIVDWALGDDRNFTGAIPGTSLVSGDNATSAYYTLKAAPNQPDANAIVQKKVTTVATPTGGISGTNLTINVFSADYEGLVFAGQFYYWDFRIITALGHTVTIATGVVQFTQNVTQTNVAGTPGPIPVGPNNGQPRFRGFAIVNPMLVPNLAGTFVQGDYFRNAAAVAASPSGWVCVVAGSLPNPPGAAQFNTDGNIGDGP